MAGVVAEGLLEREHELARVTSVLEGAASGTGAALMVEGAPGIGKTSLLDAGADLAAGSGLAVLRARGGELERALPFGVARDLLARRIATAPEDEQARLGAGAARVALPALGLGEVQWPPAEQAAINHGLTWLVADLADEQPLALLVDDVQWSDDASVAWLAHLARRVADLRVALILGARPAAGEPEPPGLVALRELPDLERLQPGALEPTSIAALVRSFYAADAEDAFIAACHDAAGGNPFHTHALLDAAAAQEIPATTAGAAALAELAPEAVRRSVAAALRRAGADARRLAQACAVLGESVDVRHAADLAGLDPSAAALAADRLVDQNLLVGGRPLRFVHPVLLAVVRDGIAAGEHAALQRRAADLFAEEGDTRRAGAHLLDVDPTGNPEVVKTLTAAAGEAAVQGALAHAARLLERALAEPPPADKRAGLMRLLGMSRFQSRAGPAMELLLAAADATFDLRERAESLYFAGFATVVEHPELLGEIVRRTTTIPKDGSEGRMRLDGMLGTMTRLTGLPPEPPTTELIAHAEPLTGATLGQRELLTAATMAADLDAVLPADRLASLALRALSVPEDMGAPALFNGAHVVAGAPDEVLAALDAKLNACHRRGDLALAVGVLTGRAGAYLALGRLREAEADARWIWEHADDRQTVFAAAARFFLLVVLAMRGSTQEALALIEEYGPLEHEPAYFADDGIRYGAGLVALEAGDVSGAAQLLLWFEQALERRGFRNPPFVPSHRPALVEALVRSGDLETARTIAEKDLELARTFEAPGRLGYALRGMGLVVGGSEGRALIEEGVALLEQSPERDRLARTLLDLGRALRHEGKPTEAREPLRRAQDLAEHCGAELVAQRAFDELRAAGAKPRRRALRGPDSLTASEARIARLAAEGQTNREIAQALFVTAKTVETHLGHVYAKLGITGRSELAAALGS